MAGVHIAITDWMVKAAADAFTSGPKVENIADVDRAARAALEAAFRVAEISMGDEPRTEVVTLTFVNHQKDVETIRLPINAHPYDFGPRGLAFRKVRVTRP